MSHVCIIGIGSDHGDDQAGWLTVAALARQGLHGSGDDSLRLLKCRAPAADLLLAMKGTDLAIIIDAVTSGAPPGTLHRFDLTDSTQTLARSAMPNWNSHGINLLEVVELARTVGLAPRYVILHGIEIDSADRGDAPGGAVCAAAEQLAKMLAQDWNTRKSGSENNFL